MRRDLAIVHLARRLSATDVLHLLRLQRPARMVLRSALALRVRRVLRRWRRPRYQRPAFHRRATWSGLSCRVIVLARTS